MRKRIIAIILLMALLAISNNALAATGSAKVYYNSNLSVGTTSSIKTILGNMGYTSTRSGNPSVSTVRNHQPVVCFFLCPDSDCSRTNLIAQNHIVYLRQFFNGLPLTFLKKIFKRGVSFKSKIRVYK